MPKAARVDAAGDLEAAVGEVGFPCVLKVDSADVVHKSDEGGVALDLADADALKAAFEAMTGKFTKASYIVQEQAPAGREIIIGATESPGLGSLVMFGLGGIFVEVMKDVVFAVAPVSRPEAGRMLRGIKGHPLLEGVRGEPGVDLEAVEDLLLRVSALAADFPSIVEMDLNPVFVHPPGTAPAAVDVRIKVK